jgi:hypothetical protein
LAASAALPAFPCRSVGVGTRCQSLIF